MNVCTDITIIVKFRLLIYYVKFAHIYSVVGRIADLSLVATAHAEVNKLQLLPPKKNFSSKNHICFHFLSLLHLSHPVYFFVTHFQLFSNRKKLFSLG